VTNRAGRLLQKIDQAGGGFITDLFLYALSAAFALVTALTSTLLPHRAWGWTAVWAYAAGFVLALVQFFFYRHKRAGLAWLVWLGVAILPMIIESVQRAHGRTDRAQDEVLVVEQMGERLLHHGTPYLSRDAIAALPLDDRLMAYSPYQPGMAIFGLPRAIVGDYWWTDARVWFTVATAAALIGAVRLLGPMRPITVRAIQAVTVLPICALTLATGGDDIPVLAFCLLAFAFVARGRYGWAGVAVGAAAACKPFAFPVVAVLVVLALAAHRGRRLPPAAIGLPVVVLIPPFLVDADAFIENVVRFPLGHGLVSSPAQSPFPGYLIAQNVPGGRIIAAALLVAVAVLITVRIVRRPPRTASEAAMIVGLGLLAAILLMPTTRFGYLLYPIGFLVWTAALTPHAKPAHSNHTAASAPAA
jgi:glycosyl transferase family 87